MSAEVAIDLDEAVAVSPELDGATAAAILLMLLPEEDAGEIVKSLDPATVRQLSEGMFKVANADEATIGLALDLFVDRCRQVSDLAVGAAPRIKTVLTHALGNVRADNILAEIAPRGSADALEMLRWMEVETISELLKQEHSQVAALVLSVLTPDVSAKALAGFEADEQTGLLTRAARLSKVSREAIEDLEVVLASYQGAGKAAPGFKVGGASDAAKIVNRMKKADGLRLISAIKQTDEALASQIEREMFLFEDLSALDSKSLGAVLRAVDGAVLTLALRGADAALLEQMLSTMSARAAQTIRDELDESAKVKRADVEEAQRTVLAAARKLADDGEIVLGAGEDDFV